MNVKELIKILSTIEGNLEIILQKDSEGNDYSPLFEIGVTGDYVPYNEWSGEMIESEDPNSKKVVVLVPTN